MIQITFTPETPEQAAVIAEAIGKYLGTVPAGGTVAEVKEPAAEAPKRTRKAAATTAESTEKSSPQPVAEQSASAPASEPDQQPETDEGNSAATSTPVATEESKDSSASPTTSVTLEEVRGFLAPLSQNGKGQEVKDLIASFGATKLTEIPAEKYGELLAAAKGL